MSETRLNSLHIHPLANKQGSLCMPQCMGYETAVAIPAYMLFPVLVETLCDVFIAPESVIYAEISEPSGIVMRICMYCFRMHTFARRDNGDAAHYGSLLVLPYAVVPQLRFLG